MRGGYRLARAAEAISALDVVDALEGDKPLFRCREVLAGCSLADLAGGVAQKAPKKHGRARLDWFAARSDGRLNARRKA